MRQQSSQGTRASAIDGGQIHFQASQMIPNHWIGPSLFILCPFVVKEALDEPLKPSCDVYSEHEVVMSVYLSL